MLCRDRLNNCTVSKHILYHTTPSHCQLNNRSNVGGDQAYRGGEQGVLRGKVIWITGASSGIGASLAEVLAANGAKLVISARNAGNLSKVKQKCIAAGLPATDVLILPMDVLEIQKHEQYFQQVIAHYGQLDILVNNAGRSQRALWEDIDIAVDKEIFKLNVFSVVSLARLAVRYFNEKGGGHLVTMSSLAGVVGAPYSGSYTATKHAIMVDLSEDYEWCSIMYNALG
ncbi:Dehydrogenase/reductase SDR member 7 [Homalodisca vitripennis]|nr:Dehydrogenase/reductase SDR member 7 [Homalodisca vitripennis]